jgi:hypothetical protein
VLNISPLYPMISTLSVAIVGHSLSIKCRWLRNLGSDNREDSMNKVDAQN